MKKTGQHTINTAKMRKDTAFFLFLHVGAEKMFHIAQRGRNLYYSFWMNMYFFNSDHVCSLQINTITPDLKRTNMIGIKTVIVLPHVCSLQIIFFILDKYVLF